MSGTSDHAAHSARSFGLDIDEEVLAEVIRIVGVRKKVSISIEELHPFEVEEGIRGTHRYKNGEHVIRIHAEGTTRVITERIIHELKHAADTDELGPGVFRKSYDASSRQWDYRANRFEIAARVFAEELAKDYKIVRRESG